jgi:hypothetical protein
MKTYQNLLKSALIAGFSLSLLACGSSSEIATPAEALVSPAPAPSPQPSSPSDQEPPVIELMGESPYSLALGQPFEDPGAKAIDDVDGEVPVTVNKPALSNIGTYAVVYSAKDSAGNESSVERTVIVNDVVAPVISLNGLQSITLEFGKSYDEPGATATDDVDGNVEVTIDGSIGEGIGSYTIIYSAVDKAGNQSSTNRTVVVEDLVGPVITLNGPKSISLGFGNPYSEQGATATDDVDGNVEVTINGSIGEGIGAYTIIYSAVDNSGNQSSSNRTVVVDDLVGPVITLNGTANIYLEFGKPYDEQGATAADDVDGELEVTVEGSVGEDVGVYMISYRATDKAGNESIIDRRVKVEKFLFEADIAKDIPQSTPTDVNIPLGIQATLDVEYLGAFRVAAGGQSSSNYAVGTLGFNPDNNSIFVAGHAHDNAVAEFQIPDELSLNENPADVVRANVFQDYVTLLDKKTEGNQTNKINGLLYYKGNLIVTSEIWYDGSGSNRDNLQIFSVGNVLSSSPFKGMLQLEGAARAAGYMSKVPAELVESLGGEYIVGWASNYSITSRYSQGPSMYVLEPQEVVDVTPTVSREVQSSVLMSFPPEEGKSLVPNGDKYLEAISPIWGPIAKAKYGFIIPGTSLFMAVGSHAGIHSGVGYKIIQDEGKECGGPCPYSAADVYNYFWLFNVNDIVNAKNPWDVQPISYGKWSHPYDDAGRNILLGATYDDDNGALYLSIANAAQIGDYDRPPMILAYKVKSKN